MTQDAPNAPLVSTDFTEKESREEQLTWRRLFSPINLIGLAWVGFQICILFFPNIDLLIRRSGHLGFACSMAIALVFRNRIGPVLIVILSALALSPTVYLAVHMERLYDRIPEIDPVFWTDYLFGFILLLLVLEASRRRLGPGLTLLAVFFIFYQLFGSYIPGVLGHRIAGLEIFVDTLFLGQGGIFGIPTRISAEIIFYFILFAAVYDCFGGGKIIMDTSLWLTGHRIGGPAKASIVASAFTGSISGSAVANVMSTGIFTIPLMKRAGYSSVFAAATEAAASTAGQIMPPVMGAAAFIMADFLQLPYYKVAFGALVPALIYLLGLMIIVHLQARSKQIKPIMASELGDLKASFQARWHMLLPLLWLIFQIARGYDVIGAVMQSTLLTIAIGSLRKSTRQSLLPILQALIRTSERTVMVALPCALASIIVMVISMTGLGTKFTSVIVDISGGNIWFAAALGGLGCLILGCGMPTTSAYIMAAILVAPALELLGFEPLVAHMYIFYIAVLAMITPPVALAAYAGASIADCSANKAGWQAFLLALPGLAMAWTMMLHPALVVWGNWFDVIVAVVHALLANALIASAIVGWLGSPLGNVHRCLVMIAAIAIILPSMILSLVGGGVALIVTLYGYRRAVTSFWQRKTAEANIS